MEILVVLFAALVVVAVVAVSAVLFCLWAVAGIAKTAGRVFSMIFLPRPAVARVGGPQACGNADCRSDNPAHARFCRRCGRPLAAFMRLIEARAA